MGHIGAGQPCTADFNTVNVNSSANLRSFVRQLEITLSAKHTHEHVLDRLLHPWSSRIRILRFFSDFKKRYF